MSGKPGFLVLSEYVDALALSDDLLLAISAEVEVGQRLCIFAPDGTYWVEVLAAERLEDHPKHNWRVTVQGEHLDLLRKELTYQVANGHRMVPPEDEPEGKQ